MIKRRLAGIFDELVNRIRILLFLFRQEKIHRYFITLIILMVVFAVVYLIIEYQNIVAYGGIELEGGLFHRIVTVIYWTIITILTKKYGHLIPQTDAGKILIILLLFMSIVVVSFFTAALASALTTKKMLEGRGIMNLSKFRDHFIICGWKKRMGKFIENMVKCNSDIILKKTIIIANIESDEIEIFRHNYPQFQDVSILRGDHYNENLLRKSNVEYAAKVLILADERHPEGSVGVDSLTVLTAMTIRSISANVTISAELTDVKFEKYLHTAHVDEIIYTNEYSNSLMASSLLQVGITKVVNDLLIQHKSACLETRRIPEEYFERDFKSLKEFFNRQKELLIVGLLENVGGFLERKKEAIRSAQKTADVKALVNNLKIAKSLENNQSHLLPEDDYLVPNNSLAIVIVKRGAQCK